MVPEGLPANHWHRFRVLLEQVPRDREAARHPVSDSGVSLDDVLNGLSWARHHDAPVFQFRPRDFTLVHNIGGGDCLFHALEDQNLTPLEVEALRHQVAAQRLHMSSDPRSNALHVAAALRQTPCTRHVAAGLMAGRHAVPNAVYAALQSVPGIYAGENEIVQWCRMRKQTVLSIDTSGTLTTINPHGATPVLPVHTSEWQAFHQAFASADIALYHASAHWQRVRRLHGAWRFAKVAKQSTE